MFFIQIFLLLSSYFAIYVLCEENNDTIANLTGPKDMFVVRATVYQVGIITNRTNETSDIDTGNQETLTLYRNNGSSIDLSKIPAPLMTNVTTEKVVGVAPVSNDSVPWTALQRLVTAPHLQVERVASYGARLEITPNRFRASRNAQDLKRQHRSPLCQRTVKNLFNNRVFNSLRISSHLDSSIQSGKSKREASKTSVEILKGAAVIPSEAGVNSIALPPLLTLNKNLSTIPVPIPNMSVVSYAKVNTLVHSP